MSLKIRFATAWRKKAKRGFSGYPVATVAFYGPDDRIATKVAVGIVLEEDRDPAVLERWFSESGDVRRDPAINEQLVRLLRTHGVKTVLATERIFGCPHEEGIDYPEGEPCPQCPFWAHRDRWSGETLQ